MSAAIVSRFDPLAPYREQARAEVAAEAIAAAETQIETRAAQLREADERAKRHVELCRKHGLPETATPAEVGRAQHRAWAEHERQVFEKLGHGAAPANYEPGTLKPVSAEVAAAVRRRRDLRLPPAA